MDACGSRGGGGEFMGDLSAGEDVGRCGSFGGTRLTAVSQSRAIIRSVAGLASEEMETSS